jgi:predicted phosphodiesterase
MKLAILSDVHANYPALLEVTQHLEAWKPDQVIVAGDLVNRGPRPAECLRFVQQKQRDAGWLTLLGNHEEYVMRHHNSTEPRSGPAFEIKRGSYWTYLKLDSDISALQAMPFSLSLRAPDDSEIRLTHASMLGTREGVYRRSTDPELREKIGAPPPPLFCVGHTHVPLTRRVDDTLVVNAGSAGMPFDGDTRASYAQVTWRHGAWEAEIIRLEYDRQQAERDFTDSGFLAEGGMLAQLMLIELQQAHSQLFQWATRFEAPLLAGLISIEDSVRQHIIERSLEP